MTTILRTTIYIAIAIAAILCCGFVYQMYFIKSEPKGELSDWIKSEAHAGDYIVPVPAASRDEMLVGYMFNQTKTSEMGFEKAMSYNGNREIVYVVNITSASQTDMLWLNDNTDLIKQYNDVHIRKGRKI